MDNDHEYFLYTIMCRHLDRVFLRLIIGPEKPCHLNLVEKTGVRRYVEEKLFSIEE